MKFKDLEFHPYKGSETTQEASLLLKNGYTVHVLKGELAAHVYGAPYELSMSPLKEEIMDDSVGYLSKTDLIELINEIENLPALKSM